MVNRIRTIFGSLRRARKNLIALAVIVILFGIIGVRAMRKPVYCRDCNVVLISLDTLSGQHLACTGYHRDTMPNLCAFASKHIFFPHSYATAQYTLPTYVSLFTGQYPSVHGITRIGDTTRLSESAPFLPSMLKNHGYRTIFVMPTENAHMPQDRVYNRGIDEVIDEYGYSWREAFAEFRNSVALGQKTFLFIHSYAVHPPYADMAQPMLYTQDWYDWILRKQEDVDSVSPAFIGSMMIALRSDAADGKFADSPRHVSYLSRLENAAGNSAAQYRAAMSEPGILAEYQATYDPLLRININDARQRDFFRAAYDQKLHEFDAAVIPELIAFADDPSVSKNTLFIVMSDHGEDFGEHGYVSHTSLFDSNTHTFFSMAAPGIGPRRINTNIQTVDIAPTILDILGYSSDSAFSGISLKKAMEGGYVPDRILIAQRESEITLRQQNWKLFVNPSGSTAVPTHMFDTKRDPYEADNILLSNLSRATALLETYGKLPPEVRRPLKR